MAGASRTIRIDFGVNDSESSLKALLDRLFGPGGIDQGRPLTLDLSDCRYLGPLAVSILAGLRLNEPNPSDLRLEPPTHQQLLAYCEFSGLLELFEVGPGPSPHPENVTTPLRTFIDREPSHMDEIVALAQRTMNLTEHSETALRVSLAELADNVRYHSKSPIGGLISARAFKNEGELRLVVADRGIGFRNALAGKLLGKHRHRTPNDVAALEDALKEGISSRSSPHNLGQGLPLLAEIVRRNGGSLLLASGHGLLNLAGGEKSPTLLLHGYPGSIALVRLKIHDSPTERKVADVWGDI